MGLGYALTTALLTGVIYYPADGRGQFLHAIRLDQTGIDSRGQALGIGHGGVVARTHDDGDVRPDFFYFH